MKKTVTIVAIILGLSIGVFLGYKFFFENKIENTSENEKIIEQNKKIGKYAITNKNAKLYVKEKDEYKEVGYIESNTKIEIEKNNSSYFKIDDLDYYLNIFDVDKTDKFETDDRYEDYVVWNLNVVTKDITKFYDKDDKLVFTINKSFDMPIIIKEKDKYGVKFNDELYYVKEIDKIIENKNTDIETRDNIRTFTYHTVYRSDQKCTSIEICHPISQFEEQMKYLHDNDYLTLTLEEVEMFLDKKIRIPTKTVALTLDDGIFLENSIPLVEKYEVYATFFIITSKTDVSKYMNSKYARFESHSDNLHNNYKCPLNRPSSQGGQMLCESEENIIKDLKLSQEKLNGSNYFAYPFFDFNDNAINALKKAGFKIAFIGQWNTNGYSTYDTDRFMVRRKTIFGNLKLPSFIEYLK